MSNVWVYAIVTVASLFFRVDLALAQPGGEPGPALPSIELQGEATSTFLGPPFLNDRIVMFVIARDCNPFHDYRIRLTYEDCDRVTGEIFYDSITRDITPDGDGYAIEMFMVEAEHIAAGHQYAVELLESFGNEWGVVDCFAGTAEHTGQVGT
jgi:hypothetical protein